MPNYTRKALIICDHASLDEARTLASTYDPGFSNAFGGDLVPAEGPDDADPTHHASCWQVTPEQYDGLQSAFNGGTYVFIDAMVTDPFVAFANLGLKTRTEP